MNIVSYFKEKQSEQGVSVVLKPECCHANPKTMALQWPKHVQNKSKISYWEDKLFFYAEI